MNNSTETSPTVKFTAVANFEVVVSVQLMRATSWQRDAQQDVKSAEAALKRAKDDLERATASVVYNEKALVEIRESVDSQSKEIFNDELIASASSTRETLTMLFKS